MLFGRPQDRLKHALWRGRKKFHTDFWALKNISFEVRRGESVGIIGRNGSGKSTLLQIIAGVLAPTDGEVLVRGRVVALLELGSGFNAEFTGRENVYLNGNILGLSKGEMDEKFDGIAAFADIGNFIDQPVKIYSSGMTIRLAFAVLAHVDPDIIIIDEALAVGDVSFQLKCMKHLRKLIAKGTTFLFVSHDPYTLKNMCERGLWLHQGEARYMGKSIATVARYRDFLKNADKDLYARERGAQGKDEERKSLKKTMGINESKLSVAVEEAAFCQLVDHKILDENDQEVTQIQRGKTIKVRVEYEVYSEVGPLASGVAIFDSSDLYICGTNTHLLKVPLPSKTGRHRYEVVYKNLNLFAGTYQFDVGLFNGDTTVYIDFHSHCMQLEVLEDEHVGDGLILLEHEYRVMEG